MSFLSGYGKRKEIRYGATKPASNLTDFPKLFKIAADSDIAAELSGGGGIAVTLADGTTTVPFGLYPSSDPTSGDLIIRAKFSPQSGASTGDVLGYLYYDAGQTTSQNKAGVVSNGYAAFMPLEEDPSGSAPQMRDWVTDTLWGTSAGSMTSGDLVAGQVGDAIDFDGVDDLIVAALSDLRQPLTVEFAENHSAADAFPCWVAHDANGNTGWRVGVVDGSDDHLRWTFGGVANYDFSTLVATKNQWNYVGLSLSGTSLSGRLNGSTEGITVGSQFATAGTQLVLGGTTWLTGSTEIAGKIDELRASSVARSADWLAYAYADDFTNSSTFTLGPQETAGGGGGGGQPAARRMGGVGFAHGGHQPGSGMMRW